MKLPRILLLSAVLLLAAALAGVAQPRFARSAATAPGRTITVGGAGAVTAVPDRATFDFGVQARASTATNALAAAAKDAAAVIAAVKAAGVPAADLQTTQISLSPTTSQDGTRILGYTASSDVSARTTVAGAGPLVDAAVRAGAATVSGPSLDVSNTDALYRDALKQALANAQAKAQTIAAAAGLRLGGVQSVVEGSAPTPVPIAAKPAVGSSVPVEAGTQEIDASVTVTYAAS